MNQAEIEAAKRLVERDSLNDLHVTYVHGNKFFADELTATQHDEILTVAAAMSELSDPGLLDPLYLAQQELLRASNQARRYYLSLLPRYLSDGATAWGLTALDLLEEKLKQFPDDQLKDRITTKTEIGLGIGTTAKSIDGALAGLQLLSFESSRTLHLDLPVPGTKQFRILEAERVRRCIAREIAMPWFTTGLQVIKKHQ